MRRPTPAIHRTGTKWIVIVRDAGYPLGKHHWLPLPGYFVRAEHGPMYLGPSVFLPKSMDWWWRPTFIKALSKGYREARKAIERVPR